MAKYKILVFNENPQLVNKIKVELEKEDIKVYFALNEQEALNILKDKSPALVISEKSTEFLRDIFKITTIPVIILDESAEITDKVVCFEMGCDDYVCIPYDSKELLCRIKAVIRRYNSNKRKINTVVYSGLTVDLDGYSIIIDGEKQDIPPKELELLYYLASNPNVAFTREQILDKVWGFDYYGDTRTVDVHIDRLRKKLKGFEKGWKIDTVFGVGYKFAVN